MAAASFRQRASQSVRRRLPRYFTKANLRGRDGCRCIPLRRISKCSTMGIFLRDAFSADRQWQDFPRDAFSAGQRWQDFSVMRSPLVDKGKMFAKCVPKCLNVARFSLDASPKDARTEKTPLRVNISPPCIQNELVLARFARGVSKKRRKPLARNTLREILARKGP